MKALQKLNIPRAGWLAAGLFVLAVLTRLPFRSQYLYHWDSVNMAFGMIDYDVQAGAPHYPGYIVYIALAQLVDLFINDHQTTLVFISLISAGLATAVIFGLGRDLWNEHTGLIAAVFLISSPLVWFYSEIALPHTLDLFAVILAVWLLYRIIQGDTRWWWLTAIYLALLGGFRQQNLLFLGPVILFALYRIGWRRIIAFLSISAVVSLMWFVPLIQSTGGIQNYLTGSSAFSAHFFTDTSLLHGAGFDGVWRNLSKLLPYTAYAWSLALLPALIYWGWRLPQCWRRWLFSRKAWFIALWIAPALTFYMLIHMGQQGLVFVFLPALLLLSAAGLDQLLHARPALRTLATAAIGIFGAVLFIFGPTHPLGANGPKLLTYSTIREHDAYLADKIHTIRARFTPQTALLLGHDWRHIQYYLPEYPLARVSISTSPDDGSIQVRSTDFELLSAHLLDTLDETWQLVLLDADLIAWVQDRAPKLIELDTGTQIAYLNLRQGEALVLEDSALRVIEQAVQDAASAMAPRGQGSMS